MDNLGAHQLIEIYTQMIGGSVPLHAGDALQSVRMVAADLLDTDRIHLLYAEDREFARVHYFALPSKALHSAHLDLRGLRTPLSAALPGQPGHQGEGVYLVTQESESAGDGFGAAAVYQRGELRLYVNDRTAIHLLLEDLGLPVFDVSLEEGAVFESQRDRFRRFSDHLSQQVGKMSATVLVLCGVGYAGLSAAAAYFQETGDHGMKAQRDSLARAASNLKLTSPLSEQLGRLHALSGVVVKTGGWIDRYQLQGDKESFTLYVPEWTSRESLIEIGPDAKTDLSEKPGLLRVTRDQGQPMASPDLISAPTEGAKPAGGTDQAASGGAAAPAGKQPGPAAALAPVSGQGVAQGAGSAAAQPAAGSAVSPAAAASAPAQPAAANAASGAR